MINGALTQLTVIVIKVWMRLFHLIITIWGLFVLSGCLLISRPQPWPPDKVTLLQISWHYKYTLHAEVTNYIRFEFKNVKLNKKNFKYGSRVVSLRSPLAFLLFVRLLQALQECSQQCLIYGNRLFWEVTLHTQNCRCQRCNYNTEQNWYDFSGVLYTSSFFCLNALFLVGPWLSLWSAPLKLKVKLECQEIK